MSPLARAKKWNSHVQLIASLLNLTAVGTIGVAVVGHIFKPESPIFWGGGDGGKLASLLTNGEPVPLLSVVQWQAIGFALVMHAAAHFVLSASAPEE